MGCAPTRDSSLPMGQFSSFLVGKSKTTPVRPIAIPRFELQAAALAVKMHGTVMDELTCKINRVMFWTDSQTTLQYIRNETKRFHTFVANRVAEIRDVTNVNQWRHCPGKLNPADDASRGLRPQKLSTQHRWWRGPEFLWQSEECWPDAKVGDIPDDDPEIRMEVRIHQINVASNVSGVSIKFLSSDQGLQKMVECCGSWITLQRRAAWLVRFCHWIAAGNPAVWEH